MLKPIKTTNGSFFTTNVYEFNGYRIKIRQTEDEKLITFQAINDIAFRPRIIFCDGEGVIDCSGIFVNPENSERVIKNIREACDAINTIKEIISFSGNS